LDLEWHLFCQLFIFHEYPTKLKERFEKLFQKHQKSLKYKCLRRFKVGIFFVNAPQRTKQPNRVAFFVRWRRHPLIESGSARPSGAAESGSHSPPKPSGSLLTSGWACEYSPKAKIRKSGA
jgi:hypothetical protein